MTEPNRRPSSPAWCGIVSTAQDIADAIKDARGITIDRRHIRLDEPIKTVGTRMVEVEVATGVTASVKTMVTEQK